MTKTFTIAQFSDSHLFADKEGLHYGAPVYQNLVNVLKDIGKQAVDCCIFTGDLTQDHTIDSYKNFLNALNDAELLVPCYFLPGNHDNYELMQTHLIGEPIDSANIIESNKWQFHLVNSKSETPAGFVSTRQIDGIKESINDQRYQFIFMHHHPVDVAYFIDRHGLTNKTEFWQQINSINNLRGIACGHIHQGRIVECEQSLSLYTCPATSIGFCSDPENLVADDTPPGYRLLSFFDDGTIETSLRYLK